MWALSLPASPSDTPGAESSLFFWGFYSFYGISITVFLGLLTAHSEGKGRELKGIFSLPFVAFWIFHMRLVPSDCTEPVSCVPGQCELRVEFSFLPPWGCSPNLLCSTAQGTNGKTSLCAAAQGVPETVIYSMPLWAGLLQAGLWAAEGSKEVVVMARAGGMPGLSGYFHFVNISSTPSFMAFIPPSLYNVKEK